ncbi:MAG: isoprenylcysteine carboxylmethyltransferase family protein, partial [Candidatus Acidiferrales bacterium]
MGTDPSVVLHCSQFAMELFWLMWRTTAQESNAMIITPGQLISASWLLLAAYWFIAAAGSKKPMKKENAAERIAHILFLGVGFFLLYGDALRFGVLNQRFLPVELWIAWLGAVLTLAGALFAIWARHTIGKEWSAEVQIKEGHRLIRSGPYAHIRHPIYTGLLLALIGTAVAI